MKILLVSDYASRAGGAEVLIYSLRDGLRARGHDARFFASSALRPEADAAADGAADYTCFGTTSSFRTLLQSANPWAARRLRQALAEFRPDVVHVKLFLTQLSPLILPELRATPALYHAVWYRAVCPTGNKLLPSGRPCAERYGPPCLANGCLPRRDYAPLMWQMERLERDRDAFDMVVANSDWTAAVMREHGLGPVERVWNGIPAAPLQPPLADPPTVAFAGRLVREKGAALLLRAFARAREAVPAAVLLLAGHGPQRAELERLAQSLEVGDAVRFLGFVPHRELEARLAGAWVQAVPSLWDEPFGLVAAEAMMRGRAVVATRSGGLQELVAGAETGLLVERGDASALAAALIRLLSDREEARRLGEAGRAWAQAHLSEEAFVDAFLAIYGRLAGARRSGA